MGAGNGGFMLIFCSPENRKNVVNSLEENGGQITQFHFIPQGIETWKI